MSLPILGLRIDANSLKALRAGRVLRPLKLVSGIPSKLFFVHSCTKATNVIDISALIRE